jgi:hypothetical protein
MGMTTAELWAKQNQHEGDRQRLFRAVADAIVARTVLYPGSYVDIAPSFVWADVTYVDVDKRAATFFADVDGVRTIIDSQSGHPADPAFRFIHADYTTELILETTVDLLVSLYAGPVSMNCTRYLRVGGMLLVNPSHGDAALASIDDRYELHGVVTSRAGEYSVHTEELDRYLIPKRPVEVTVELIERTGRGIGYTRSPFAYLFQRVR